jgi:hypothetical protein
MVRNTSPPNSIRLLSRRPEQPPYGQRKDVLRIIQSMFKHADPAESELVRDEDVARLSPLGHEHINMLGRYAFSLPDKIATQELGSARRGGLKEALPSNSVPLLLAPRVPLND